MELPGPWPGLCQEVLLRAQREWVGISVATRTFLLTLTCRRYSEACLQMVEAKGQAMAKAN